MLADLSIKLLHICLFLEITYQSAFSCPSVSSILKRDAASPSPTFCQGFIFGFHTVENSYPIYHICLLGDGLIHEIEFEALELKYVSISTCHPVITIFSSLKFDVNTRKVSVAHCCFLITFKKKHGNLHKAFPSNP